MVDVNDLNVPPRTLGEDALVGSLARDLFSGKLVRTYRARVLDGTPTATGRVRVLIDGTATTAKLRSTAKAVQSGDNVEVVKTGGLWHVVGSDTWRQPPTVSGSMGNPPPAAATGPSTNLGRLARGGPTAPANPSGSSNNQLYTWAVNARAWMRDVEGYLDSVRTVANRAVDVLGPTRDAVNTNASRLNQTRDYAGNAGQLVEPVVDALKDERIVR